MIIKGIDSQSDDICNHVFELQYCDYFKFFVNKYLYDTIDFNFDFDIDLERRGSNNLLTDDSNTNAIFEFKKCLKIIISNFYKILKILIPDMKFNIIKINDKYVKKNQTTTKTKTHDHAAKGKEAAVPINTNTNKTQSDSHFSDYYDLCLFDFYCCENINNSRSCGIITL